MHAGKDSRQFNSLPICTNHIGASPCVPASGHVAFDGAYNYFYYFAGFPDGLTPHARKLP